MLCFVFLLHITCRGFQSTMIPSPFALGATLVASIVTVHYAHAATDSLQTTLVKPARAINGIAPTTRSYWMRQANQALADVLGTPCPFAAFGTAIVNHTGHGLGNLICIGANTNPETGNPTLHGEIAAIQNCTSILTDPKGPYNLTAAESLLAFSQLSLYTNAESCPMCASAIRWAGFKEYIYGTSIDRLVGEGWAQIRISSMEVFRQSFDLASTTRLMGEVLANETDPYFLWQYDPDYRCPSGCARRNGRCKAH
ncbi:hypothetical protein LMH87_010309 [Akanthomyces muscarius]|uniref:CMP/dCMP-type deaminase domain-containing protein n=1 Tax=Akanthomyces muscarius TaxID=2231603 RepID=A0A9W8QFS9_AKAMU|nr:hypothetical protein LMH87_010309 [Akanthomyces muscarius]KAJ4153839.1 hypothetical protein LMH87_010309 [Akanthomyces muscarius]